MLLKKKDENFTIESIQPLPFYLITPIQRIPRYELLIRDMLRDVGKDFPDLESLKKAYLDAKESAKGVNQTKMKLEENEKYSLVRDIIKGNLKIEDEVYRKFICSGPLYFVENVNTPPTKQIYLFLFNDVLLETTPSKHAGKSIESQDEINSAFEELREINNIKDLSNWEFSLIRELPFTLGSCSFKPITDSSTVKHVFSILVREYKVIRGVEKDFPTLAKFSWKAIINDQFRYIDEQIENNERVKNSRGDIVTSELTRIEQKRNQTLTQSLKPTVTQSQTSKSSTALSTPSVSSISSDSSNGTSVVNKTLTNSSGTSTSSKQSTPNQLTIKYNADTVGNLVTSGNVISAITKKLVELGDSRKSNNDEEFFKTIDERLMDDKGKEHYKRVVHEMTETERIHLRGLEILKEVYLFPITKSSNPESVSFVKGITSQIDIIIGVHKKFLNMLEAGEKTSNSGDLPMLGANFIKNIQFLKMAATYISKYSTYLEGLTEIMKKEKDIVKLQAKAKQEYLKTHEGAKIELISFYLITPIQRIPRYELLIRDMLRDVGKDFPDLESLKKAYLDAKESAKGVNQTRMKLEENEKMDTIQKIIEQMPSFENASSRKFISCGPFAIVDNMNDPPTKMVYMFLFNDMLVETKIIRFNKTKFGSSKPFDPVLFNQLSDIKDVSELNDAVFEFSNVYYFSVTSKIIPQADSSTVKNVIMCMLVEQKEVWNSLLHDQIAWTKEIDEKKRKKQKDLEEGADASVVLTPSKTDEKHQVRILDKSHVKFICKKSGKLVQSPEPINTLAQTIPDLLDNPIPGDEELFKPVKEKVIDDDEIEDMEKSERQHLQYLEILKEVFLQPSIKLVTKSQTTLINDIITQVDVMINIHQTFLATFVNSITNSGGSELPQLGFGFVKSIQFLKMESTYSTNYVNYLNSMSEICKESNVAKAQNKAKDLYLHKHNDITEINDIHFYLTAPMERIIRYTDFLRVLIQNTGSNFADFESLKTAYLDSEQTYTSVSKIKRETEENEKIVTLTKSIQGENIKEIITSKQFITCGLLFVVKNIDEIPNDWSYFFLFSDILIETSPTKFEGKPIKSLTEVFPKLQLIKTIKELDEWEFEVVKEYPFTSETLLEEYVTRQVCKNLVNIKITQIPHRFSSPTPHEAHIWNSILFDKTKKKNLVIIKKEKQHEEKHEEKREEQKIDNGNGDKQQSIKSRIAIFNSYQSNDFFKSLNDIQSAAQSSKMSKGASSMNKDAKSDEGKKEKGGKGRSKEIKKHRGTTEKKDSKKDNKKDEPKKEGKTKRKSLVQENCLKFEQVVKELEK
ncbi:Rho/RAC guanine nucleotide exchange factor [Entamoeba marina]